MILMGMERKVYGSMVREVSGLMMILKVENKSLSIGV
jgi:hypothetical protein